MGSSIASPLQWRHNGLAGVSHHQPYDCLLNRLFRRRSQKTSKLRVIGLCEGKFTLHKRPVTRKMFPFDDVITTSHAHDTALTEVRVKLGGRKPVDISFFVYVEPV